MGGSSGSVQVRSSLRDRVLEVAERVARQEGIHCLVGPAINGWVGIYPEGNGQDQDIGAAIAKEHGGDVFHLMVHDEDIMAYWLWREGELLDSYWSRPGYFGEESRAEEEAMAGRPEAFEELAPGKAERIRELLKRDAGAHVFEQSRLGDFADLLGIRNAVTAYEYLKEGDTEDVEGWKEFVEVPREAVKREKKSADSRRRQINATIKRMKNEGILLAYVAQKRKIPRIAAAGDGFVVTWEGHTGPRIPVERYGPPWDRPEELGIDAQPQINAMASDSGGNRLAIAMGNRVVVWETQRWEKALEIPETDWAITVALRPDGKVVAHSSRKEIVVTEVDTGRRLGSLEMQGHWRIALHPSGKWLVIGSLSLGLYSLDGAGQLRWLFVGGRSSYPQLIAGAVRAKISLAHLREAEERFRSETESAIRQLQNMTGPGGRKLGEEQIAQMRREMEKQWETTRGALADAMAGKPMGPPQGNERPGEIGFSADGRWLWCGTDKGLRVYRWDEVAGAARAAGEDMPRPAWAFDTPERPEGGPGYVYAVAEEPGGEGLVFAGISGRIYRMDLETGGVRELMDMPEGEPVIALAMSRDGTALGIVSRPGMMDLKGQREQRGVWSVWAYGRMGR